MAKTLNLDEGKIVDMYVNKKMSSVKIAPSFNTTSPKIRRVLKNNGIKIRDGLELNKEEIINLYINKNKSVNSISKLFGCSINPILKILRDNNIKIIKKWIDKKSPTKGKTYDEYYGKERADEIRRKKVIQLTGKKRSAEIVYKFKKIGESQRIKLDLNLIKNLYLLKEMSLEEIANELNVGATTLWKRLKEIGITLRRNKTERAIEKIKIARAKQIMPKGNLHPRFGKKASEKWKEWRKNIIFPMKDTSIEVKIQDFLKALHIEFFTHQYISEISHKYRCDIFIPKQETEGVIVSQNTIIEADGCYWHGCKICNKKISEFQEKQIEEDEIRTKELQEKGYKVIRLWEHDIKRMELGDLKDIIK